RPDSKPPLATRLSPVSRPAGPAAAGATAAVSAVASATASATLMLFSWLTILPQSAAELRDAGSLLGLEPARVAGRPDLWHEEVDRVEQEAELRPLALRPAHV